jgi:putative endonuclease
VGSTELLPVQRLADHLDETYGNTKFTAKTKDWILFFFIECENKSQALKIERHIKNMKSRLYIQNLVKFPNISLKLLNKYY